MYRQRNRLITRYRGLSTDDKPQNAEHGSTFHEMDTGTVYYFDANAEQWHEGPNGYEEKTVSGNPIYVTDALSDNVKSLTLELKPIQSGSGDPSADNIRPISGRTEVNVWSEATYDTNANPVFTITLGQTVYGVTVDVTTGVMTVDSVYEDIKANVNSYARANADTSGQYYYRRWNGSTDTYNADAGKLFTHGSIGNPYAYSVVGRNNIATVLHSSIGAEIRVGSFGYDTLADWVAYISSQDACGIVYPLAQPISVQLTPQQLKLLKGENTVWSDGNEITMTYKAKKGA